MQSENLIKTFPARKNAHRILFLISKRRTFIRIIIETRHEISEMKIYAWLRNRSQLARRKYVLQTLFLYINRFCASKASTTRASFYLLKKISRRVWIWYNPKNLNKWLSAKFRFPLLCISNENIFKLS